VFDEADSADPIAGVSPEQSVPRGHSIPLANPGTGTEPKQP
jgi:hypothetical protein